MSPCFSAGSAVKPKQSFVHTSGFSEFDRLFELIFQTFLLLCSVYLNVNTSAWFRKFCGPYIMVFAELPTSKCPVQSAQTYVFQHRCYDIHVEAKSSVAKASKDCQDNSGTLATRIVEPTHLFLAGALKRLEQKHVISPQNNVWIGLSRFAGIQPWNWHWQNSTYCPRITNLSCWKYLNVVF